MFIADVVNVRADERNLNPETGKLELAEANPLVDRKSTRLNSSHSGQSRMPSSA